MMIQVLRRALTILEYIAGQPEAPRGVTEIAAQVGLNPATCARILKELAEAGYLEQTAPRKGYVLGPMAYVLAARGPYRRDLTQAAEPLMAQLAQETGETVLLAVLRQGRRIVLSQIEGGRSVQVRGDLLQRYNPYESATGRLLLAHLSPAELRLVRARHGEPGPEWPEARGAERLNEALARLRGEELVLRAVGTDVVGIACPIRQGPDVVAALGLYLPAHRFAGEHRDRVLRGVRRVAAAVSQGGTNDIG